MGSRVILPSKYAGETAKYEFDFAGLLGVTETISTQVCTAAVYSGTDASPSSVVSGSASASGTIVTQTFTAGVLGVIYEITCTITTSASQTLALTGFLSIIPKLP
jgi:hypothetical protein